MFPDASKLKIACLIHSLDGGGAERVMAGLASRLAGRGHAVTLVTLNDGLHDRHAVDSGVKRMPLSVMGDSGSAVTALVNLRRRVIAIRKSMVDIGPDVVLSFCDRTNILGLMAIKGMPPIRLGGNATDTPIVISERSDPSQQSLGPAYSWLRCRMYPRADRVIAQTDSSASFLRSALRLSRVDVIASAVDLPLAFSDRDGASGNRRIVSVGRLEHEKGFDRLIEAMAIVSKVHPEWSLRIVGEGSQRQSLQTQIDRLNLGDRVSMPGWIQPASPELCEATVYVLPSRYEGFPSALMEAMAAGVPSVAVDCPSGPRAIIEDAQNGLLVSNDVAGIASGIQRMISDAAFRERIGEAGFDVVQRFGWDAMVDHYERVLRDAAGIK